MRLLNEKEVAAMLGVTPVMLRKQRCLGQTPGGAPVVPFLKMGNRVRYDEADVIAYVGGLKAASMEVVR